MDSIDPHPLAGTRKRAVKIIKNMTPDSIFKLKMHKNVCGQGFILDSTGVALSNRVEPPSLL